MSEVARQYNIMTQTLQQGMAGIESSRIAQAQLGMQAAALEYEISDPTRRLQRERSQDIINRRDALKKQDLTVDNIMDTIGAFSPGDKLAFAKQVFPRMQRDLGLTVKDGKIMESDGTPLNAWEFRNKPDILASLHANIDGREFLRRRRDELAADLDPNDQSPKAQAARATLKTIRARLADMNTNPAKYARKNFFNLANLVSQCDDPSRFQHHLQVAALELKKAWDLEIATKKLNPANLKHYVFERFDENGVKQYMSVPRGKNLPFGPGAPDYDALTKAGWAPSEGWGKDKKMTVSDFKVGVLSKIFAEGPESVPEWARNFAMGKEENTVKWIYDRISKDMFLSQKFNSMDPAQQREFVLSEAFKYNVTKKGEAFYRGDADKIRYAATLGLVDKDKFIELMQEAEFWSPENIEKLQQAVP